MKLASKAHGVFHWAWGHRGGKEVVLYSCIFTLLLQRLKKLTRLMEDRVWNTGQLGHLDAIALAGGAGLHFMQKHHATRGLTRTQVHIASMVVKRGKLGELKVMRRKKREGLGLVVQICRNGTGQGQAVRGRCHP